MSRGRCPQSKAEVRQGNAGQGRRCSHHRQNHYSSTHCHKCSQGYMRHIRHQECHHQATDMFQKCYPSNLAHIVARMGRTLDRSHHSSRHHRRAGTGPRRTRSRWGKRLGRARRMAERRRSRRHRFDPVGSQLRRCTARSTRRNSKVRWARHHRNPGCRNHMDSRKRPGRCRR